jgi:DNA-binding response OmpR family regulator
MSPSPTVLVFDDEEDLREVMCRMLQRRGFDTLGAARPEEAVDICRTHPGEIDVLLADLGMPDAVGVELAREATAIRPHLRVLFVSGLPKDAAVAQGLLPGDAVVVQKPFTTDSLVGAVRDALAAATAGT